VPTKNPPLAKKTKASNKDYVGVYDGSKDRWMSRRKTDKGGNIKEGMAPESSRPSEANDYHEGFNRKRYDAKNKSKPKSKINFLEPKKVKK
jgi:hypothetical protein